MARNTTSENHISVIIPVYNEMAGINATIAHVLETAGDQAVEIIVADGGPENATLAVLEDPAVVKVASRPGRGTQMNAGAALASGRILLFLHADTRLPDGWSTDVGQVLQQDVRAGAFSLSIDSSRVALGVVALFANLRTRWERVPYGDQAHFFEARFFHELGGYADIPIMEDVELFKRIRKQGDNILLLSKKVQTSPRRWETEGVFRRTVANWWLRIRYGFGASPAHLVAGYRPHGENRK
ncbi:TIGR04283 family arsenosugar biosynthesis glycosyltransferase [Pseudodesulfovibrio sediminis]|uniref:Glycosyl transferase family 2 n=1 Tax=Pseudodesulfovibrio sediminis TaxID=2810563 RepID=A0ABM7PAD7_9BACT|nr:TIGR04283 family arsenosugar biosynthesis glycosyltransferase [Pseudodesulfovibrio sediminis]BCS90075.1 glycosyl transferase family 2 [Pseudodesulfovibrio sediminis]